MLPTFSYLFIYVCASYLFYLFANAIYQLFISPLRNVPGPWYAAISGIWLHIHAVRLQQCQTVHELFEKYGPIVRIAPDKIAFNDVDTARRVYSVLRLDKSMFYKGLQTNNNDHAMTTLPKTAHPQRRKTYTSHYNMANLARFDLEIRSTVRELVDILKQNGGHTPADCLVLFRHLMVDVASATSFGTHGSALTTWARAFGTSEVDIAEEPVSQLSNAIGHFGTRAVLRSNFPAWAWSVMSRFPHEGWRQICACDAIMAKYVRARVEEARGRMTSSDDAEQGLRVESDKACMVERLLAQSTASADRKSGFVLSENDVLSETMGHLIAGVDTSAVSLSYLCWELSRRPDIVKCLRAELDHAVSEAELESATSLETPTLFKLPYLNAFVKEGLRLYSAVPSLLERVVPSPSTGKASQTPLVLLGYAIPPGTIVATQPYSMHRDPAVFPEPNVFRPSRWLDMSEEQSEAAAQHMAPFGLGTRMCGGMNLAQTVMRLVVTAVVQNFDVVAPPETTEQSMQMRDAFALFPAGMECRLVFVPRKGSGM